MAVCAFLPFFQHAALSRWRQQQPDGPKPELIVQQSHFIEALAFNKDATLLASGGIDGTIKLWNLAARAEVRTLVGPPSVTSVAFSPSENILASASRDDKTITVWDTISGSQKCSWAAYTPPKRPPTDIYDWEITPTTERISSLDDPRYPHAVAFSPDGLTLVSLGGDMSLKFWDVRTCAEKTSPINATLDISSNVGDVAFDREGGIQVAEHGEELRLFKVRAAAALKTSNLGKALWFRSAFSQDGRTLIAYEPEKKIELWDTSSAQRLSRLTPEGEEAYAVAVSNDRKLIATGVPYGLMVRDLDKKVSFKLKGARAGVQDLVLSPDEKSLLYLYGRGVKVWNLEAGVMERSYPLPFRGKIALSTDLRHVAGADKDTIYVFNLATGQLRQIKYKLKGEVGAVAVSPDGETVAVGDYDYGHAHSLILWDVGANSTRELFESFQPWRRIMTVAFSPDGKSLAAGGRGKVVSLWDVEKAKIGEESHKAVALEPAFSMTGRDILSIAFNPTDRTQVAVGCLDHSVRVVDFKSEVVVREIDTGAGPDLAVCFSPDGHYLFSGGGDKTIKRWDLRDRGATPTTYAAHSDSVNSLRMNGDGGVLYSGGNDGRVIIWDTKNQKELLSLAALGADESPGNVEPGGWLVSSPEGRFDTDSIETVDTLHWRFEDTALTPLPLEIFMRQYFEPGLLRRTLLREGLAPVAPVATVNRVQPNVSIRVTGETASPPTVRGVVEVSSASGEQTLRGRRVTLQSGAFDLRIFRDGQLVDYRSGNLVGDPTGKAYIPFIVKLPEVKGADKFELSAYAFNSDHVKSSTARYVFEPKKPLTPKKGRAYVVSVGVSAYQYPSWDLDFAALDAEVSAQILAERLAAAGEYEEVVPLVLTSAYEQGAAGRVVTRELATKRNFHTVLEVLARGQDKVGAGLVKDIPGADRLRKAEPEDLVLIYFSSHGYTDQQGKFYLVPFDTGVTIKYEYGARKYEYGARQIAPESLAHFVSSDELSEWLRDMDAGELVLVVDTCHSAGAVAEPGFKPGPMGSKGMGQLAYDKGMRVLAASQADDVALELGKLKQGLLTYALVREGLERGEADTDKDGKVRLDEWLAYGVARVPGLYADVVADRLEELKRKDVQITDLLAGCSVQKNAFQQPQLFDFKRKRREVFISGIF